jgi:hypothetical protein
MDSTYYTDERGGKGLGNDSRVVRKDRAGHGRTDPGRLGPPAQRAERNPRFSHMRLVGLPRLEAIAGRQEAEASPGRCTADRLAAVP